MGRPFENWEKKRIQEKWGMITRYVNEDQNVPLVVADDDISGTLTFVRALSDSGLYEKTPADFFGKTWLNYLIPDKTILWWGNMCHSTEHTAYIRLKQGYNSPESGSMKLNGKEVAEQIGAQIFIDGFGMVAPGRPELAVELARKAAGVSHDGEAIYAAMVTAAMVSIAFVEKNMETILDQAVSFIPPDSIIARVHKDVRTWAKEFDDWNDTFAEIEKKYGYDKFGGNCHVVPNHAVMVMAWSYGRNDFFKTMSIVNTAGWDTDCNAGNVGSVTALCAGLEHLCDTYDFRTPFADRIFIPTADGTFCVSDVLEQAMFIARTGRSIMDMPPLGKPKNGAKYHFEMPGALHGFLPATENTYAVNTPAPAEFSGKYCLEFAYHSAADTPCRIETHLVPNVNDIYATVHTPVIYSGNTINARGKMEKNSGTLRMYLSMTNGEFIYSPAAKTTPDGSFDLTWEPEFSGSAAALGFEYNSESTVSGKVLIDFISVRGISKFASLSGDKNYYPWICSMAGTRSMPFSNDRLPGMRYFIGNTEPGIMVTGNRSWGNTHISTQFQIHSADRAGIIFHYQGLCRWTGVIFTRHNLQIVRNFYGEKTLAETDFVYQENQPMQLEIEVCKDKITVSVDGNVLLTAEDNLLESGGAGIFADCGMCGIGNFEVEAQITDF